MALIFLFNALHSIGYLLLDDNLIAPLGPSKQRTQIYRKSKKFDLLPCFGVDVDIGAFSALDFSIFLGVEISSKSGGVGRFNFGLNIQGLFGALVRSLSTILCAEDCAPSRRLKIMICKMSQSG